MAIRRNRIVKPYRGKLYDMVVKNFAYVPVLNARGKQVKEKGKIKKIRRKEVTDAFEIYYNLCLVDEYFKVIYEKRLKGDNTLMSTLKEDFGNSWRYLIRKYAFKAPRGTRELAVKVETRLGVIDKNINDGLAAVLFGKDINEVMGMLKAASSGTEFKKTIQFFADFIRQAFQMLGFNVETEVKSNPKFNIRYVQFSIGDEVSELISNSSSMVSAEIEKANKLKKIRDAKLKSSLLKQGYLVDVKPVFLNEGRNKGVAYITVAYDAQATQIPKPRSKPKSPEFRGKEYNLIVNLESLVKNDNVYPSDVDPKQFFIEPKCSILKDDENGPSIVYEIGEEEKNEIIIEQIKSAMSLAEQFSVPKFKEGYGKLPNGEPEAGYNRAGIPNYRYKVPKSKLKGYQQAVRVFKKLLQLRAMCENKVAQSKEVFEYHKAIKPLIKGAYSSDFTDELGNTYQRFNNIEELAKKVIKKKREKRAEKATLPKITGETITVENYPDWDGTKIVYTERKVRIAKFKYPSGSTYNPIHHKDLLQEALNRINLGRNPELDPNLKDQVLTPVFREVKGSDGLSKTFQLVKLKNAEGKDTEIIVAGRYAGYDLDTILNMEGRFIEGGYISKSGGKNTKVATDRIAFDKQGNAITVDKVKDGDSWEYKQRLIEPYITVNPKTGVLTLGIPGENSSKADRNIMKSLAEKVTGITTQKNSKLPTGHKGRNPFFTFTPYDFEIIRESLGSVAMSASASKFMDEYYAKLRAKEKATTAENTERFTPEALGGFVAETSRGQLKFNNKQKEAAAWLEASGMQGVVALDTGVGKTLTSLVAIKKAINEELEQGGTKRRFLFVSPKSLVGNLKKEVLNFMVEGGDDFVRADGEVEKTPNWQKLVLSRIDEMSYEDFVDEFKKSEGIDDIISEMENGEQIIADKKRLARENKHHGKEATVTYEVGYKNGREIWRNEVDFQIGNLIDPTIVRTASTEEDEVRTVQELVSYPALDPSAKEAKKKELAKVRRAHTKLKKSAKAKSSPIVNKKFQDKYYACFFDEINEIFGKGGTQKNYAVSSLGHPRKVFLTASALDRDPVDLYRLATLAKGKVPTKKSEKAFAEKYGVVLAGRMVALNPDPKLREQFHNWVKENAYFAPKMDISVNEEFGVDYEDVNLPRLQELKSRTITTRMPKAIQKKYKSQAKAISGELKAMVSKYRDLRGKLDKLTDKSGDFFDRTNSKAYQDLTKATSTVKSALNRLIKTSSEGMFKADVGSKVFKDNFKERCLYFCSNKRLATSVIKKNSKVRKDKVHALLWAKEIVFYQNGKVIAKIEEQDNMSVEAFDEKYIDTGIYTKIATEEVEEDTESESTWAMDISRKYVKENASLASAICSDNYARGFNFQTFTKVIHLDRGKGFDSELLKQRTARAYRGGQAKQVEEIYIDATFAPDSESEGTVSESARGLKVDLKNALSLQRNELEEGKTYIVYVWFKDPSDELGDEWLNTDEFVFNATDETLEVKLNQLFNSMGYVKPLTVGEQGYIEEGGNEPVKRIVLLEGTDIKERATVKEDFDMLSIDQIKSLVNEADQDFFQDIIVNGLKSDLTGRLDARISDTGIAIKTPALMRFVLDPTEENQSRAEKELEDFDANPCSHLNYDPSRYDDADMWLSDKVNRGGTISKSDKQILDMVGGPVALDLLLGEGKITAHSNGIRMEENRFVTGASVTIYSDHISNNFVKLKPCAPRGFSSKFLFSEIITAKRMGKKYIECLAAGSAGDSTYSGYAVWPKFGFDLDVNISRLLNRISADSPNYVYAEAVRQILGESPGVKRLQQLLVITADIVTLKVSKKDAKIHKKAMKEWGEVKQDALGDRPVMPPRPTAPTPSIDWRVGDKVRADSNYVRNNYPQMYNQLGTITEVSSSDIKVTLDESGYSTRLNKNTTYISLVNPRPVPTVSDDIDRDAIQESIEDYDRRSAEYDASNPKPPAPEPKRNVEERVAVGEKIWGLYGSSGNMRLDLKDGSTSMRIANSYLKKKALEQNIDLNDYLNSPPDLFNTEDPWCWEQEINTVKVKGQQVKWTEVVSQYPEAFRTAWYAHKRLRAKVGQLCGSEKALNDFMKKYRLVDPQTDSNTPSPEARSLQSRTRSNKSDAEYSAENVGQRIKLGADEISDAISDRRLWEESQDPCLQAVWEELRLENYAGQIVSELIEGEEDPDLIEVQRARKA